MSSQYFKVVDETTVKRIPKKKFEDFYFSNKPTIDGLEPGRFHLVTAVIQNVNGKADKIVRFYSEMIPVDSNGCLDKIEHQKYLNTVALAEGRDLFNITGAKDGGAPSGSSVIDSQDRFAQKRAHAWNAELSPAIEQAVAKIIFGKRYAK